MKDGAVGQNEQPIWMRLGSYFYLIASVLTVVSLSTNITALISPDRILDAFHVRYEGQPIWEFYIRVRSVLALSLISLFGVCLLVAQWVRPMTYGVIGYLMIYLLIDLVTVIVFGQISAEVFALLSARLAVIVLLMTAISQYVALFNQRL